MPRVIVLVGMMGSGKSTVGQRLAAKLHMHFLDTDDLVVASAGKPIRDIFSEDGEPTFRIMESQVLADALSFSSDVVVAAAGGTVVIEQNRQALVEHADVVVWLDADISTLDSRTRHGAHRPLLDDDGKTRLAALDRERRRLYESVATVRIDTAGKSVGEVLQLVIDAVAPEHAS